MKKFLARNAKRLAAMICCLVMMVGLLPASALAAETYTVTVKYTSETAGYMPLIDPDPLYGPYPGDYTYTVGGAPFTMSFNPDPIKVEGYHLWNYNFFIVGETLITKGMNYNEKSVQTAIETALAKGSRKIDIEFYLVADYYTVKVCRQNGTLVGKIFVPVGGKITTNDLDDINNILPSTEAIDELYRDPYLNTTWTLDVEVKNNMTLYLTTKAVTPSSFGVIFDSNRSDASYDTYDIGLVDFLSVIPEPRIAPNPTVGDSSVWVFDGWYHSPECEDDWDFKFDKVTEPTTLYAKWKRISYSITQTQWVFDAVTGKTQITPLLSPVTSNFGENPNISIPVIPDYTLFYATISNGVSQTYMPIMPFSYFESYVKAATKNWTDDCAIEYVYTYTPAVPPLQYNVTFNANGGLFDDDQPLRTIKVDYLGLILPAEILPAVIPDDPTREDPLIYEFAGWYHDEACTDDYDFDFDRVLGNITIYAKWNKISYKVEVKYTIDMPEYAGNLTPPFPERAGEKYEYVPIGTSFLGPDPNHTPITNSTPTGDYIFQGVYLNGVFIRQSQFTNATAEKYITATTATNGYTKDLEIEYIFEADHFTVTFDCAGGCWDDIEGFNTWSDQVDLGKPVKQARDPARKGYTFVDWFTKDDELYEFSSIVEGTMTLYAGWSKNSYSLTFKYQDDDKTPDKTISLLYGSTIPVNTFYLEELYPTKEGHTLLGWWYNDGGIGKYWNLATTTMPPNNVWLFADWKVNEHEVVYIDSEPDHPETIKPYEVGPHTRGYGLPIHPPIFLKPGYTLIGWYDDSGKKVDGDYRMPDRNIEVTAWWNKIQLTEVSFKYNGATVKPAQVEDGVFEFTVNASDVANVNLKFDDLKFTIINADDTSDLAYHTQKNEETLSSFKLFTDLGDSIYSATEAAVRGANGDIFTFYIVDSTMDTIIGKFIVKWDIPVSVTEIRGYNNGSAWQLISPYEPPYPEGNTIVSLSHFPKLSGIRIAHTTGTLTVNVYNNVGDLLYVIPSTTQNFTHPPIDLKTPVVYKAFSGGMLLATVTVFPSFKVDFDVKGGDWNVDTNNWFTTDEKEQYVKYGATATSITPAQPGYAFDGWYDAENPTVKWNFNTEIVSKVDLYAKWTKLYTVEFNPDYGTFEGLDDGVWIIKSVREGAKLVPPSIPVLAGYTFKGWYEDVNDPETEWDFDTGLVYSYHKLTAKWELKTYTLIFSGNGGTPATATSLNVSYFAYLYGHDPYVTREGYTFAGWYVDDELVDITATQVYDVAKEGEDTIVVRAEWDVITYNVRFKPDNGNGPFYQEVDHFGKLIEPAPPVKDGCSFEGWYIEDPTNVVSAVEWDFDTEVTKMQYLIAKWDVAVYDVTFLVSDGGAQIGDPYKRPHMWQIDGIALYGERLDLDAVVHDPDYYPGYKFVGWYFAGTDIECDFNSLYVTKNTTLYAKWDINDHLVVFYDWNWNELSRQTVAYGSAAVAPTTLPNRPGYTFTGWSVNFSNVTSDLYISPKYDQIIYTVTLYDEFDGSIIYDSPHVYGEDLHPELYVPTRAGVNYIKWVYDNGTDFTAGDKVGEDNVVLNAKCEWIYNPLILNVDGVEFSRDMYHIGEMITLPTINDLLLDPTGKCISGWYTDSGCTMPTTPLTVFTMSASSETLYTKIKTSEYTVTYYDNENSTWIKEYLNRPYGETIVPVSGIDAPVAPAGKMFDNWYYENDIGRPFIVGETVKGPVNLYARWKPIPNPSWEFDFFVNDLGISLSPVAIDDETYLLEVLDSDFILCFPISIRLPSAGTNALVTLTPENPVDPFPPGFIITPSILGGDLLYIEASWAFGALGNVEVDLLASGALTLEIKVDGIVIGTLIIQY